MGKKGISKNKHSICIDQIQEYVLGNQETATEEVCEFFWRGKCSVLDLMQASIYLSHCGQDNREF